MFGTAALFTDSRYPDDATTLASTLELSWSQPELLRLIEQYPRLAIKIPAFTAGAIGTMIIAVMTRVSLGHTGRALRTDRATTLIYSAITISAVTRVAAAFAATPAMGLLEVSATLWIVGFLMFGATYGPKLLSPRIEAGQRPA
jgi:hypothetical protein